MRREHGDESGDTRYNSARQRHGRRGNAGRIAAGLLTARRQLRAMAMGKCTFMKCYLMVRLVHRAYALEHAVPPRLPPAQAVGSAARLSEKPMPVAGVDMAVVASKRVVAGLATSSAAGVFAAAGNRLMTKVLLIEDDGETAEEITAELADRGFEVEWSANGLEGLDKARSSKPDAMIVDRLLPGMDGLTVIEALRKDEMRTPVLVLSALGAVDDRVRGLRMGGDDYLTKPFALVELVARVEALLRRPAESRETILRAGPLELDLIERTARRGDRAIDLLPREFRLLEYMMQRCDQLLTRAMLLEEVWNYKFVPATNLVDVHMGRLRHKVDGPGEAPMIHNVRGAGFILRTGS
jgi:two-component system OmpR family response regulator